MSTMRTEKAPQSLLKPMRSVLRLGLIFGVVAIPVAMGIGYLIADMPGLWGALLGVGISVVFFTITAVVAVATARLQPQWLGLAVMGSWLLKLIGLIAVLVVIDDADFYSPGVFFVSLIISTVAYLGMDAVIVARTRVLYLETEFAESDADA